MLVCMPEGNRKTLPQMNNGVLGMLAQYVQYLVTVLKVCVNSTYVQCVATVLTVRKKGTHSA